ncbi:acyltransferase family protein [Arthrobacter sp. H14-L1]|uniref:acyltransferase family protein n=1 Tax=Arthrobacter sp. H14-L1 TaxID=2996697 RepID=UPI00226E3B4E|nr:acyltransferase family protein [Arthrobacter sp. H14-L1]MCY0903569.1 acyltransferase family protein [Arthrobacter sp. H14-L1]
MPSRHFAATADMSALRVTRTSRADIQGLRTLAVGLVVIYHLFPGALPGGFVGVDVFFVISGFLIVGSLVREAVKTGGVDLLGFYSRRIRRLLPAATVVLVATIGAAVVLLPQGRWQGVARDVVMSALQVQNWNQAFSAASYEGATSLVSPVQHYWSLAVEEQFYIIIPLVLMAATACAHLLKCGKEMTSLALLVTVTVASFVHSVIFSAASHDVAYFATTTRMWELGLGGILAVLVPKFTVRSLPAVIAGWAGFALVVVSAVFYSTEMQFPGWIAVVPVAGTMLILAAGSLSAGVPARYSMTGILGLRSVTYIGDISYSLYLWHWPVIVFYVFVLGHAPNLYQGAIILVLSMALAVFSYRCIEGPLRRGRPVKTPLGQHFKATVPRWSAYSLGVTLVALSCLTAWAPWTIVQTKIDQRNSAIDSVDYPGALAFQAGNPANVKHGLPVRPDPTVATMDGPVTSQDGCNAYDPAAVADTACWYGDLSGTSTAVVVGDSHAAQYVDPLIDVVAPMGWKVRAMVRNGCPFSATPPASADTTYTNCSGQNKTTLQKILDMKPQLVVVGGMTADGYEQALHWNWAGGTPDLVRGYVSLLKPLVEAGIKVEVVLDNPYPLVSVPDCVQMNGADSPKCQLNQPDEARTTDPLGEAAAKIPGLGVVDLHDYFCADGTCPAVIGNVLVYRDNHMTNTFAKTLTGPLGAALGF